MRKYVFSGVVILVALLTAVAGLTYAQELVNRGQIGTQANPIGTSFTYQGQLKLDGKPVNEACDFQFGLYDALSLGNQVGVTQTENITVTDGLFTVNLDFGDVFTGTARWLGIAVNCSDGSYTGLGRQELTATPYALYAMGSPWSGLVDVPSGFADDTDNTDDTVSWDEVSGIVGDGASQVAVGDHVHPGSDITSAVPTATLALSTTQASWSGLVGIPGDIADGDDDTIYDAGFGLTLVGTTFNVLTDTVQTRVTGECAPGSMVSAVNADGTVVCETDDDTSYAAGTALELDGTTFNVLTNTVQTRVTGECAIGSMVRAINADGTVECDPHDTLPVFNQITLESDGNIGHDSSIIIGADGLPIISYTDATNYILKVAHCNDPACTSATTSTIDTSEADGVRQTSITIGADGLPIISYYGQTSHDLKVAHCDNTTCTSATITNLDTTDDVGDYSSITIGADGLAIISYYDVTAGDLNVAHCSNITCTSATITGVDTTDDVGNYSSITIGVDGLAIISYYDYTNTNLKIAHCSNLNCTSVTSNTLYSGTGGVVTSITIGNDGLPIIAFRTTDTGSTLTVAHCNEIICATVTSTNLYAYSSYVQGTITIGADGLPIIAFRDNATKKLRVAHCNNVACTSASITIQDNSAQVGGPSITIGVDGMPIISYTENNLGDLKVTHCSNVFCVPYFRRR